MPLNNLNNLPPLQSQSANFDQPGFEAVKADIQQLAVLVGQDTAISIAAGDRFLCPRTGIAQFWASSNTATVSSSTAYHTITCVRSGQSETGISLVTTTNELVAYQEYFMGEIPVSQGNTIAVQVTVTGSPSPTLSSANFSLRCQLTPTQSPTR
jgi:hypothetical protein